MRVTQLYSDLGRPILVGPEVEQRGTGAVIDLEGLIPEGGLGPGKTSVAKRITVRFDPFNDIMRGGWWRDMFTYRAEVFAPARGG